MEGGGRGKLGDWINLVDFPLFCTGDNVCDFLFVFVHIKPFLKWGLLGENSFLLV